MKNLLIIISILLLVSCKTKQVTITKTNTVHDTVFKEKQVKVNVPIYNTIEVAADCDSVTGQLKPFKQEIKAGPVSVTVESKDGKLTAEVNIDSIKQVAVSDFRRTLTTEKETKEIIITKYKVPSWCWWLLLYAIVITIYTFRKPIFNLVSNWYPPLKGLKIFSKLV